MRQPRLVHSCRAVDPQSTDYALAHAADQDVIPREPPATPPPPSGAITEEAVEATPADDDFREGIAEGD